MVSEEDLDQLQSLTDRIAKEVRGEGDIAQGEEMEDEEETGFSPQPEDNLGMKKSYL